MRRARERGRGRVVEEPRGVECFLQAHQAARSALIVGGRLVGNGFSMSSVTSVRGMSVEDFGKEYQDLRRSVDTSPQREGPFARRSILLAS